MLTAPHGAVWLRTDPDQIHARIGTQRIQNRAANRNDYFPLTIQ